MTVKLYALKCDQGYIRYREGSLSSVKLEKAGVYPAPDNPGLEEAAEAARRAKLSNLKIVELTLEERDFSWL